MYRDCLGNTYSKIVDKKRDTPGHTAKASSGGTGKIGRCCRKGEWRLKVNERERRHRNWGHRFKSYGG